MSTQQLLAEVKQANQDFEWYPTTDEIIEVINNDIKNDYHFDKPSILDCGAGDGRVLKAIEHASRRYAIEKSKPLLDALDRDIFVVGTDFEEQTLIDKKVSVIFSNPPYSQFEAWSVKIIREARSQVIYLVIPTRWEHSKGIAEAIELRSAKAYKMGEFDFLSADRSARAKVNIVKVDLGSSYNSYRRPDYGSKTDPFELWFDEHFSIDVNGSSEHFKHAQSSTTLQEKAKNALVSGDNIIPVLEQLYQAELDNLVQTYKQLEKVDGHLLNELNVSLKGIREGLNQRIGGLKNLYWQELFNNLNRVTSKLTHKSRETMLNKLTAYTHVDFTCSNAYAVVIWVIKNANHYFDDQLIDLVERLTEQANVSAYVSNQKTFGEEGWYYGRPNFDKLTHFKLEHRCVLQRVGGICVSDWGYQRDQYKGLSEGAYNALKDIQTVASNLGFDTAEHETPLDYEWESNKTRVFHCTNVRKGREEILMQVKAFKNGNLHVKFNSDFMCKLNVEFGRLKGWVKSKQEAASELNIDINQVEEFFGSNIQLAPSNVMRLEMKVAA